MEKKGWIKFHRKLLDNPVVMKDGDHLALWAYILLRASHKPQDVYFGKERITLRPGQFTTGREEIAAKLRIDDSKIDRMLKRFESEHQIKQQMSSKCRLITVINWHLYQETEQESEQQMSSERASTEQQVSTNKEDKNIRKKEWEKGEDGELPLAPTPKEDAYAFFESTERQEAEVKRFATQGIPEETAKRELAKFISYWTEKNPSGKKQRWEIEKTFEIHLRLANWMRNVDRFASQGKGRNPNGNVKLHDGSEAKWWGGKWVDAANPNVTIDLAYYPELTKN